MEMNKLEYQIEGSTMQTLIITLQPGETIFSETGSLLMMTPHVEMSTKATGGLGGMLKRAITGNSLLLNHFHAKRGQEEVMFTTRMPGHIVPFQLNETGEIVVEKHAFLCAEESVEYGAALTLKLGRFMGGNGLFFNYLRGQGKAFISVDGEVVQRELKTGETILVHPGHIAAFTKSIGYEATLMKGVSNFLFGGDGLYMIRLTGPGKVWLHSLTAHNLAIILSEYMNGKVK
jgi:uncharacterized protein (TIGR00266 family)